MCFIAILEMRVNIWRFLWKILFNKIPFIDANVVPWCHQGLSLSSIGQKEEEYVKVIWLNV